MKLSQILAQKFEKQNRDSKSSRLPLAIGIYVDNETFTGSFEHDNELIEGYQFTAELATFPVYAIDYDDHGLTFKCKFALDKRYTTEVTLEEAMLIDLNLNDFDTIWMQLYGKSYEISPDGAEFIRETLEDGKTYAQFIYVDAYPAIDLDNTSWADYHAMENFEEDKGLAKGLAKSTAYKALKENEDMIHTYTITFLTNEQPDECRIDIDAETAEDAIARFSEEAAEAFYGQTIAEVLSIACDGKKMPNSIVADMNASYIEECDGGEGGDAGGAAAAGGDAGGGMADAGDIAGEMNSMTTTVDVLGKNEPGKGFFGKDNFYIPSRVSHPLHRYEICNGGSKRKKGKNGKDKKYAYEKGMKVVVDMFESNAPAKWTYREQMIAADPSPKGYDLKQAPEADDPNFIRPIKTKIPANAEFGEDESGDSYMQIPFKTRDKAVKFALARNDDYCNLMLHYLTNDNSNGFDQAEFNDEYDEYSTTRDKNNISIKQDGYGSYNNGHMTVWSCEITQNIVDHIDEDDEDLEASSPEVDQKKITKRLKKIASTLKSMQDVEKVSNDFDSQGDAALAKMPDTDKFQKTKQMFIDFGRFLKDICTGDWKASWFTITMVAVAIAYVLAPVDLIPDPLPVPFPGVGYIDDAFVIGLVYSAIEDEFNEWKSQRH